MTNAGPGPFSSERAAVNPPKNTSVMPSTRMPVRAGRDPVRQLVEEDGPEEQEGSEDGVRERATGPEAREPPVGEA